ncbi:MAG: hypothetical protein ABID67_01920 [Candidatus Nealsonbacteria bacterium]
MSLELNILRRFEMDFSIVKLNEREKEVIVDVVIQKSSASAATPWIKILNKSGKVCSLSHLDVLCSKKEFLKIRKGSVLKIHIRETINNIKLVNFPDVPEIVKDNQYTWECTICNTGGRVNSGILTEVDSRGEGAKDLIKEVLEAHKTIFPDCGYTDYVQIYNENFVLLGNLGRFLKEIAIK